MNKFQIWFLVLGLSLLPVWVILWWWLWSSSWYKELDKLPSPSYFQTWVDENLKVGEVLNINLSGKVVCSKNKCWKVKLATNPWEWKKWLQGVDFLSPNSWMLFVFPVQKEWWFWMSGTLIPLDIIWINQDWVVTKIWKWAKPCEFMPCEIQRGIGKYVFEIRSR